MARLNRQWCRSRRWSSAEVVFTPENLSIHHIHLNASCLGVGPLTIQLSNLKSTIFAHCGSDLASRLQSTPWPPSWFWKRPCVLCHVRPMLCFAWPLLCMTVSFQKNLNLLQHCLEHISACHARQCPAPSQQELRGSQMSSTWLIHKSDASHWCCYWNSDLLDEWCMELKKWVNRWVMFVNVKIPIHRTEASDNEWCNSWQSENSKEHLIFLHIANILFYLHFTFCKYIRTRSESKVISCLPNFVLNLFGDQAHLRGWCHWHVELIYCSLFFQHLFQHISSVKSQIKHTRSILELRMLSK